MPFTSNSLPALNPYQPNHNKPVPTATKGILLGFEVLLLRLPTYITEAKAAKPAVAWTTIPPAKSSTPHVDSKPPPHRITSYNVCYTKLLRFRRV